MILDFDSYEFLIRQLPAHKRQPNRLALFDWAIAQIRLLWVGFTAWRNDIIYQVNVTGQKLSLVDFLNRKVENSNNAIDIIETTDSGIYFSTETENGDYHFLSKASENSDNIEVPLQGEGQAALTVDS